MEVSGSSTKKEYFFCFSSYISLSLMFHIQFQANKQFLAKEFNLFWPISGPRFWMIKSVPQQMTSNNYIAMFSHQEWKYHILPWLFSWGLCCILREAKLDFKNGVSARLWMASRTFKWWEEGWHCKECKHLSWSEILVICLFWICTSTSFHTWSSRISLQKRFLWILSPPTSSNTSQCS